MFYDSESRSHGDGQWHCPFPREWVEQMRRAAKHCELLTAQQVAAAYERIDGGYYYKVPHGDFIRYDQDARGLPIGYANDGGRNVSCDIYDYDTIPDVMISNGHEEWPLKMWEPVLRA